eukprot:scaffold19225_cov107-Isochrysis_galbana.AAC.4
MAPPSCASALTGDFLAVPPSPKRPREDEQPEVRRTALTVPGLAVAGQQRHHRHTLCCGLSETAQRNRGASALHLSKPHN